MIGMSLRLQLLAFALACVALVDAEAAEAKRAGKKNPAVRTPHVWAWKAEGVPVPDAPRLQAG
jgi:hypothetical protein